MRRRAPGSGLRARDLRVDVKRQTEELNRIPIHVVGAMLGLKLPSRGGSRCPFPDHADRKPSFQIGATGLRWICFGCNRKGGSIDLVKHFLGLDFAGARAWLLDRTAIAPTGGRTTPRRPSPSEPEFGDTQTRVETPPDAELFEAFLSRCPLQDDGQAYLSRRAISRETIAKFRISQLGQSRPVLKALLDQFGFERTQRSGLLTGASTATRSALVFWSGSLVFPYVEGARVASLQARYFKDDASRISWQNLRGRRHRIYNLGAIDAPETSISICEGVMDTLSAAELGLTAIGLMGVSGRLTPDQIRMLGQKDVRLLLDWDPAGDARSVSLVEELARFGVSATRAPRPSLTAGDLNEYLVEKARR